VVHEIDSDDSLYDEMMRNTFEKALTIDQIEDVFEKGRLIREVVNEERQATGIAKAPYVVSFIRMLLDAGEKVLLFAYHHAAMDIYAEQLKEYGIVFITGRESTKQKEEAVNMFMNGTTDICCISLRAAVGLNLQRASCVVFGELDWSPAVHSQAEDRAHRVGQKDSVLCYYLVCSMGSDQDVQDALGLKISEFNGLMGMRDETEEERMLSQSAASEHMKRIVERLKNRSL
jgi:SNF2 family DNA or RNA helicase